MPFTWIPTTIIFVSTNTNDIAHNLQLNCKFKFNLRGVNGVLRIADIGSPMMTANCSSLIGHVQNGKKMVYVVLYMK